MSSRAIGCFQLAALLWAAGGPSEEIGSPGPVRHGRWGFRLGFSFDQAKWEPDEHVTRDANSELTNWERFKSRQKTSYLEGGYGLFGAWEGYFRVGAADFVGKGLFFNNFNSVSDLQRDRDFKDGFRPFAGVGVRGLIYDTPEVAVGPFMQGSWFSDYEDREASGDGRFVQEARVHELREYKLGMGLRVRLATRFQLYGGPYFYWSQLELEIDEVAAGTGAPLWRDANDYEEAQNIGVFAGLRLGFGDGWSAALEAQQRSGFSFGLSIGKSF